MDWVFIGMVSIGAKIVLQSERKLMTAEELKKAWPGGLLDAKGGRADRFLPNVRS